MAASFRTRSILIDSGLNYGIVLSLRFVVDPVVVVFSRYVTRHAKTGIHTVYFQISMCIGTVFSKNYTVRLNVEDFALNY